jgi:hypothetical protein
MEDAPELTDAEYDALLHELQAMEATLDRLGGPVAGLSDRWRTCLPLGPGHPQTVRLRAGLEDVGLVLIRRPTGRAWTCPPPTPARFGCLRNPTTVASRRAETGQLCCGAAEGIERQSPRNQSWLLASSIDGILDLFAQVSILG